MKHYIIYISFLLLSVPAFSQKIIGVGGIDTTIFGDFQGRELEDSVSCHIWLKNWGTQYISGQCNLYAAVDTGSGNFIPALVLTPTSTTLSLNPGDSTMYNFDLKLDPAYFKVGPDVIVIWPVMAGTLTRDSARRDFIIITDPTSVVQIGNDKKIKVYPNPGIDEVYIKQEGMADNPVKYIKVTDVSGRFVAELFNKDVVRMGEYKNGTYLLEVHFKDNSVKTYRIVKE